MVDIRALERVDPSGDPAQWVIGYDSPERGFYRCTFSVQQWQGGKWVRLEADDPRLTDPVRQKIRDAMRAIMQSDTYSQLMAPLGKSFHRCTVLMQARGNKGIIMQRLSGDDFATLRLMHEEITPGYDKLYRSMNIIRTEFTGCTTKKKAPDLAGFSDLFRGLDPALIDDNNMS